MNDNVAVGEGDPEIPQVTKEVGHDHHEVDRNGILCGTFGGIEDELVFLSFFDEVVLWCKKYMWCEV